MRMMIFHLMIYQKMLMKQLCKRLITINLLQKASMMDLMVKDMLLLRVIVSVRNLLNYLLVIAGNSKSFITMENLHEAIHICGKLRMKIASGSVSLKNIRSRKKAISDLNSQVLLWIPMQLADICMNLMSGKEITILSSMVRLWSQESRKISLILKEFSNQMVITLEIFMEIKSAWRNWIRLDQFSLRRSNLLKQCFLNLIKNRRAQISKVSMDLLKLLISVEIK